MHFGLHPDLKRFVQHWAWSRRHRPQQRKLKKVVSSRHEGIRLQDQRAAKPEISMLSDGTDLIELSDL